MVKNNDIKKIKKIKLLRYYNSFKEKELFYNIHSKFSLRCLKMAKKPISNPMISKSYEIFLIIIILYQSNDSNLNIINFFVKIAQFMYYNKISIVITL